VSWRNLPHLVTIARGVAGPVVAWLLLTGRGWPAFWLFVTAALTDLVDGWLARRVGADPRWGLVLDVAADRSLGLCSWLALGWTGWAPAWMVALAVARDLTVVTLWLRLRRLGLLHTPSRLGQVATSFEGAAMGILLFHGPWLGVHWPSVGATVGLSALACSIGSSLLYLAYPPRTSRP
jgi:cardiolipin synthase